MAHLRTYKSFNLQEIEEIESRIFGPTSPDENILKTCPGSTNIPNVSYETNNGTFGHASKFFGHNASNWESIQVLKLYT